MSDIQRMKFEDMKVGDIFANLPEQLEIHTELPYHAFWIKRDTRTAAMLYSVGSVYTMPEDEDTLFMVISNTKELARNFAYLTKRELI